MMKTNRTYRFSDLTIQRLEELSRQRELPQTTIIEQLIRRKLRKRV